MRFCLGSGRKIMTCLNYHRSCTPVQNSMTRLQTSRGLAATAVLSCHSVSAWASPVCLVNKPDRSYRPMHVCTDYRNRSLSFRWLPDAELTRSTLFCQLLSAVTSNWEWHLVQYRDPWVHFARSNPTNPIHKLTDPIQSDPQCVSVFPYNPIQSIEPPAAKTISLTCINLFSILYWRHGVNGVNNN